jgi:hypothetical protein
MGNEEKQSVARGTYALPEELARHVPRQLFAPDELRGACHKAGDGLGREDARKAKFRTAAQMVAIWRGLNLPAWEAPYVLRDAPRLLEGLRKSPDLRRNVRTSDRSCCRVPLGSEVAKEAEVRARGPASRRSGRAPCGDSPW